ncbi:uncharacterized protein [Ptychodera flava]|uniref:uncharacterized protein isoform X2 n=1 Tax=Ptychodera flava TaxID=63121 RepID=UPI00396A8379
MAAFDPPLILVLSVILCPSLSEAFSKEYSYRNCLKPQQDIRISFPEDAEIGTTVFRPPTDRYSIPRGLIFEGNTDERFEFNTYSSTYRLQKYLDYSNHKEFNITVGWYQTTFDGKDKTCVKQRLYIEIEDKDNWPPFFNESCNLPARDPMGNAVEWPVLVKYGDYGHNTLASIRRQSSNVWMNANFKNCSCIIFIALPFNKRYIPWRFVDESDLNITCFDETTRFQGLENVNIRLYRDFDDFPDNSAIDQSVLREYYLDHPLLEIRLTHGLNLAALEVMEERKINCYAELMKEEKYSQSISFSAKPIGCPTGKYGLQCEKQCICENGATCHTFTGACLCPIQWKGAACDIPKSKFIKFEKQQYHLYINHYSKIDCVFYQFNPLVQPSIEWFHNGSLITYEENERSKVRRTPEHSCIEIAETQDYHAGTYDVVVRDEFGVTYNDSTMIKILGCNNNFFGEKCNKICNCNNSRKCDRISGCECLPGWRGDRCNTVCEEGKYGEKCASTCSCQNDGSCDAVTGECQCLDQTCGQFCEVTCSCSREETYECDNVTGCVCLPSEYPAIAESSLNSESKIFPVIVASSAAFFLITAVILVAYRQRCGKPPDPGIPNDPEIDEIIQENLEAMKDWLLDPTNVTIYFGKRILGQGEFSRVLPAQLKSNRITCDVAVKQITKSRYDYISHPNFCEEILRLIKLHNHPNIIKLHGVILSRDMKYMVLEYASRGDMFAYIKSLSLQRMSKVEEERLVRLARDVTLALQYLEEKTIVHRDVAARNVLITEDYVAKLADFGLSRDIKRCDGNYVKPPWSEGQGPLPLKWMPPEFVNRGIFKIKSDIWSFGILMWEIATLGATPYGNVSQYELMTIQRNGQRPERPKACSKKWFTVMRKCWHAPLQLRPSAKALTGELDDVMTSDEKIFIGTLILDLRHFILPPGGKNTHLNNNVEV